MAAVCVCVSEYPHEVIDLYTRTNLLPDSPFIQSCLAWDKPVTTETSSKTTGALWDISVLQPIDNLPLLIDGRVDLMPLTVYQWTPLIPHFGCCLSHLLLFF